VGIELFKIYIFHFLKVFINIIIKMIVQGKKVNQVKYRKVHLNFILYFYSFKVAR